MRTQGVSAYSQVGAKLAAAIVAGALAASIAGCAAPPLARPGEAAREEAAAQERASSSQASEGTAPDAGVDAPATPNAPATPDIPAADATASQSAPTDAAPASPDAQPPAAPEGSEQGTAPGIPGTANQQKSAAATESSLASWTEGSTSLQVLTDFVAAATTEGGASYIPPADRVAVFDLDGTLMCETYPWCFEYMVFADYVLNNPDYSPTANVDEVAQEILDSAWGEKPKDMSTRQARAAALAYAGLTPEELEAYVAGFKTSPAEGYEGMTRGEAWFKPMTEVVSYLQANDFDIYIVTATERNIVRAIVEGSLDIDPSHVIGTEFGYKATGQGMEEDGDYTFQMGDKVVFDGSYEGENAKMTKVDAIVREIGKQPVLAFGNSSGDAAMLSYALSDNPYPSAAFMVLADDTVRDYGDAAEAAEDRAAWDEAGFTVFSMRDDFATIYGEGVTKAPVTPQKEATSTAKETTATTPSV